MRAEKERSLLYIIYEAEALNFTIMTDRVELKEQNRIIVEIILNLRCAMISYN